MQGHRNNGRGQCKVGVRHDSNATHQCAIAMPVGIAICQRLRHTRPARLSLARQLLCVREKAPKFGAHAHTYMWKYRFKSVITPTNGCGFYGLTSQILLYYSPVMSCCTTTRLCMGQYMHASIHLQVCVWYVLSCRTPKVVILRDNITWSSSVHVLQATAAHK